MNTALAQRPNILRKDLDGHWYSIPQELDEDFAIMKEAIILAEWGSDEWHDAADSFTNLFGKYAKE